MRYRAEIDGLRALAVVPVILFHAGFELFSGGFVGVDVFFVISGYLITSIILKEMDEGKFSLVNFYERRARRILPALFFVMLVCIPFASMWLMPTDFKGFAQSLVAVATFTSNIFFWQESGYFDTATELKPLLHTWSLAVEEQYYILFPLFLMLAWRLGKRGILIVLVVVSVVSFAMAVVASTLADHPRVVSGNFYLLPTRGWELLVGALVAFYMQNRGDRCSVTTVSQSVSILGLMLVAYSVFAFDESTPFPGLYALAPTIGTALIIVFAVKGTLVNTLLSYKVFVGIGLISYSAYLWHQPLLAFTRYRHLSEPSDLVLLAICIVTFPLAYLSWRFVEKPFRNKRFVERKVVFSTAVAIGLCFISIGLIVAVTTSSKAIYAGNDVKWLIQPSENDDNFLLYGDSHSKQYYKALFATYGKGSLLAHGARA